MILTANIRVGTEDSPILRSIAESSHIGAINQSYLIALAEAIEVACERAQAADGFKYEYIGGPDGEPDFEGVISKVRP